MDALVCELKPTVGVSIFWICLRHSLHHQNVEKVDLLVVRCPETVLVGPTHIVQATRGHPSPRLWGSPPLVRLFK